VAAHVAWVLNLDADLELEGGAGYSPSPSIRKATALHAARVVGSFVREGDVLVSDDSREGCAAGLVGRAFCPTPRAVRAMHRAGATPAPHPPVEVLRHVASRAFSMSMGATLAGSELVLARERAREKLKDAPPVGIAWRCKPLFGMAGRHQRVVAPGELVGRDLAHVQRGIDAGGLVIEPNVELLAEYAMHGLLGSNGSVRTGVLVRQECDARGGWVSSVRATLDGEGERDVDARLRQEALRVAEALHRAGYFGPFGVDAFVYRGHDREPVLQPRSEINARYTMGFAVGMNGLYETNPPPAL
jgi:hypothetical protein